MFASIQRIALVLIAIVGLLAATGAARAADPRLTALAPHGWQRGTDVAVTLSGRNLQDIQELLFYSSGFVVKELTSDKPNEAQAVIAIEPNCRVGFHVLRVRTETGVSDMAAVFVGALPQVDEVEPNNDFHAPQPIELNSSVLGKIETEDVDYYVVEAKKGQRISVEIEGLRFGRTFFDPYVAILNSERFELARSDDATLVQQDSICQIVAPEDGKYIIEVRETAYGGDGNCVYRLHVGAFPRPLAVTPSGGRPGETIEFTWLGDVTGPWKETITIPSDASGVHELFATTSDGMAPSPNYIRINDLPHVSEQEPNNSPAEATPTAEPPAAPVAFDGAISEPGDVDFFRFTAKKDQSFVIRLYARDPLRSPLDGVVNVMDADGRNIAGNDDSGGPDSRVDFKAPEDGEYLVRVRDHLDAGGPEFVYRVEVAAPQPAVAIGVEERERYFSTTLQVPRGNRMVLMFTARRENIGGDMRLEFPNLPQGVTAEVPVMAADQPNVPVLFTAAADAPLNGTLTEVLARFVEEDKQQYVGRLEQRTMLVRGQNNVDVWGHNSDRMAAAAIDEAPFTLHIVQPQVPIVRDGSMNLKVVAERKEGFTAPIKIDMAYAPPGIGASGGVSIAEGQSEALIPLTANGSAALQTWKIAVIGRGPVPGGNVEVATPFADLQVTDNHFAFNFLKAAVEQGQEVDLQVEVTKKHDWDGAAVVELLGLPAGATAEPVEITKDATSMAFRIKTTEEARDGKHNALVCRAVITQNGEPITCTLGTGEVRIDKPLPAPTETKPAEAKKEEPKKESPPPEKPLTRLEMLRKMREEGK